MQNPDTVEQAFLWLEEHGKSQSDPEAWFEAMQKVQEREVRDLLRRSPVIGGRKIG